VLAASIAETKAKAFAGIADSLLALDKQLHMDITRLEQQVAQERTKKEPNNAKLNEYQNLLFTARQQQDSLVVHFEQHYPDFYKLKYKGTIVTPQQLQEELDDKTAVVEYVLADSSLYLITLTRHRFDLQTLPINSSLHRQLRAFRNSIRLQQQDLYKDLATKLYQRLWPKDLPARIKQVIIIPDGVLATIPFEALMITDPIQVKQNKPTYVLERYSISYAYSTTLLYENILATKIKKTKESKHLLALAPIFTNTATSESTIREVLIENTNSLTAADTAVNAKFDSTSNVSHKAFSKSNSTERGLLLDGRYVSPLPASEGEVKGIAKLFKAKKGVTALYIHEQAKEEILKSKELSFYNYVHLATHGFVNSSRAELSGLLLAQDSTSQEDGILYAGEIYNLNLQAELVTLSACETGLGKLAKGEGIIGLTRAFLYAGASNVAVSLWKVADESTSELMQAFYKRMLNGESKAKALQGAKLSLLENKKYAHPYFWAPFILIGK
jgi:CHAT domain-containing protein